VLESILLGLLQGVTEFLPVSSSGHLALAGILFHVKDAGLTLNVLLHVGTLVATAIVLRVRLREAFLSGVRALFKPELFRTTPGGKDAFFVILASIPTGIIGLALRDRVEIWSLSPLILGLGFLATSILLVATRFAKPGLVEHPVWQAALLLGLAQGIAVLPGVSRSGATIAVALYLGVKRERAFELSMLMSVPAVLGAALIELPHMVENISDVGVAIAGAVVACISGVFAMLFLRRVVVGGKFPYFALWVSPLAVATLAMSRSWPD
jgi:undecaprenyl-diphosphatase